MTIVWLIGMPIAAQESGLIVGLNHTDNRGHQARANRHMAERVSREGAPV